MTLFHKYSSAVYLVVDEALRSSRRKSWDAIRNTFPYLVPLVLDLFLAIYARPAFPSFLVRSFLHVFLTISTKEVSSAELKSLFLINVSPSQFHYATFSLIPFGYPRSRFSSL